MFVDKPLTGLHAVQTLSRLNRIHPEKTDTFVLDFRNDAEDIQEAFKPYYDATVATPTDPNLLYDTRRDLDGYDVLRPDEIENAARLLASLGNGRDLGMVYALLDPAVERFKALSEHEQEGFRGALDRFTHVYSFLAQVVSFSDTKLEGDYLYCRGLATLLPGSREGRLDLGQEVELTHLRVEKTFEGSVSLDEGGGEVRTIFDGRGPRHEPEAEHLSKIIEIINERFAMNLTDADQILFEQFEQAWIDDQTLAAQARENDLANFRFAFDKTFMNTIVTRMDANNEIFKRVLDDQDFRAVLADYYVKKVYDGLRKRSGGLDVSVA
jgi:type I restriction enzyme R subunit